MDWTELPVREIVTVIQDAIKVSEGTLSVAITGGEPILHSEFDGVLNGIKTFPINLSINSNGILLRESLVVKAIEANVRSFTISIEGDEDVYASLYGSEKGKRKFDTLIHNLERLARLNIHYYLNCTVTPKNIGKVLQVIQIAKQLGSRGVSLSRVYPIGRALNNFKRLYISWNDWLELINRISSLSTESFRIIVEDNVLRHLWDKKYEHEVRNASLRGRVWGGYLTGVSYAQILADGTVLPDPYLELPAGNVYRNAFDDIWLNSKLLKSLRNRKNLGGACGTCEDKYICGGHRGRSFGLLGDYLGEDPFCPKSRFESQLSEGAEISMGY
jgi:radical SAM protein with 4Fe4S-binding SPASM domain